MMEYVSHISQTLAELGDKMTSLIFGAPLYKDESGYFPDKDISKVFAAFHKSIDNLRAKLGDERYVRMGILADEARAHFEADPDKRNGRYERGLDCLFSIEELLKEARRRANPRNDRG